MRLQPKDFFSAVLVFLCMTGFSQIKKPDSLRNLLSTETIDSNRVKLMWQLANALYISKPDTAMELAQNALYLARSKKYIEDESRSLGILANTFRVIGNYPQALELNLQKLKIEEKRENYRSLASVLMNIGIVYVYQEEYHKSLEYYAKADSVIKKYNVEDFKYNIALNIGDAYDRLNISDSAYFYFNLSLEIANERNDIDLIGTSMTGLGHSYQKLGKYSESLRNYRTAIKLLEEAEDYEVLCEAALGLARLFEKMNRNDSARKYAAYSLSVARGGFLLREYEAALFLTDHYKKLNKIDSAFAYADYTRQLNDTLNSKDKIRKMQILSTNEQFRQREIQESKKISAKKRYKQMQLLLIGIFIPIFFLLTLLMSKSKIHIRVIRVLGILSLLFFFEYLTLWLHPTVAEFTNHTPVYEIMIFVCVAAILIPLHHRLEHWLVHRLIHHRVHYGKNYKPLNVPSEEDKKIHPDKSG